MDPLEVLRLALAEASSATPEPGEEYNAARAAPSAALDAVIDYLRAMGLERAALLHLLAALDDANNGRSNPILTKAPYDPKRPRMATKLRMELPTVSAAITILVRECGKPLDEAIKKASKAIRVGPGKLANFYDELNKDRYDKAVLDQYKFMLNFRDRYPEIGPAECAELILENAKSLR
ncbi:MAG: hypothetical protein E5V22_26925 [Mesorhizobium sp.]|uniref:hypothetical protein n=1 Tax=Mesorhizobium sp. TaxID=1871066 RepID=UPI000FE70EF2|nr:hypothetical protein [Mesorhizobium sp.]RWE53860.1 MAG: hypothetical protein EOS24_26075 [Mesorhizobium sp.]TIX99527.1 MAG: hypothetical protein E5V22_26925 [Mesorhizobium sp.]